MGFFLAVVALGWVFKSQSRIRDLEEQQLRLQREFARLKDILENRLSEWNVARAASPTKEQPQTPAPPPPAPKIPTAIAPPPLVREPPRIVRPEPAAPPPPPSQPRPAPTAVSQPVFKPSFDWEAMVGVKLFSWIAGIALVLAAVLFLKYSADHGWLSPSVRMAIGLLTGAALLVLCELKVARSYAVTANALDATGIAILFATFFAGHDRWNLMGATPTFIMMALVTAVAVLLSIRRNSMVVALLGLVGGFATPALLATGEDRPIALFSYLLLLNAGLAWVAYRRNWPYLTVLSVVFTTVYQWGWVFRFLQAGSIPLALGIFTAFPILSFVAVSLAQRKGTLVEKPFMFRQTSAVSAALPMLFAVYMAAVPAYATRYWLLFGFLFLINAGLTVVAAKRGPEVLHFAGAVGTIATLFTWLQLSYTSDAYPAILGIVAGFVFFYLIAGFWAFKEFEARGFWVVPLLLFSFSALAALEPATASPGIFFGVLFVLVAATAVFGVMRRNGVIHLASAIPALAAGTVWSAKYLDSSRLYASLFVYLVFGLFYLAVPLLARGFPVFGPTQYLALAGQGFLFFVALQQSLATTPFPFLAVLAVLNLAIGVAVLYTRRSGVYLGALVLSQVLLIAWQATVQTAPWQVVAILGSLTVAAMGLLWFLIGRRLAIPLTQQTGPLLAVASISASLLGFAVVLVAVTMPGVPGVALLILATAILVCFVLTIDQLTEWRLLAPLAVIAGAFVVSAWSGIHFVPAKWSSELLFAGILYALFLGYPLLIGLAVKTSIGPHLAAALAGVPFFFFARHSLLAAGFEAGIGLLPVTQAALMSGLLWRLLQQERDGERTMGRLALVAGTVLAFVTVAIPLQLEKQWITIGWALQAAALAWLCRRIPHKGLLLWTSGLLFAVFVRLVLNPAILIYYPRSTIPIVNWYLYTYLVAAVAFFVTAWLLRHSDRIHAVIPAISPLASAGGVVLLFFLLNIEIADYHSTGATLEYFSAGLAQDLSYTIGWGLFAFGLLSAGILLSHKVARVAAILLLSVTVGKCFLLDLSRLDGLYRIASFVGLAICLTLVALLLQRFVLRPQSEVKGA